MIFRTPFDSQTPQSMDDLPPARDLPPAQNSICSGMSPAHRRSGAIVAIAAEAGTGRESLAAWFFCLALISLAAVLYQAVLLARVASAAPSAEQRREAQTLQTAVTKAGNLYNQKKFKESAEVIQEVQATAEKLASGSDPEMLALLETVYPRLETARALLELEGFSIPPLKKPERSEPQKTPAPPGGAKPGVPAAGGAPSFTGEIGPLLAGKCGRCHVADRKGGFSMTSYAALMKGSADGIVVRPGDGVASRLVEVIETGDMPRGGAKVTAGELDRLKQWIAAGAKFDGADPNAAIASSSSSLGSGSRGGFLPDGETTHSRDSPASAPAGRRSPR